jgi:hypothetical protein
VLSDPALRNAYDKATEFDVESMALEEYLRRFTNLILTVNGLGHVGLGWGDEAEDMDPELLAFFGAPSSASQSLPERLSDAAADACSSYAGR